MKIKIRFAILAHVIRLTKVIVGLLLLFVGISSVYSQTGPGGVGTSATNKLWLKAGIIAQADGTAVTTWADASGNNYNFGQATAGLKPTYKTGILNGQPIVRFSGANALNSATVTSATGDKTVFGVLNSTTNSYIFDNNEAASGRFIAAISTSGSYYDGAWKGTSHGSGAAAKVYSWVLANAGAESFANGVNISTGTIFATTCKMGSTQVLGSRFDQSTFMMNGDMAEWIVYQGALNKAQRIIIENYLAAKYGLAITGDKYAYEATHLNEVAGIGRVDASNQHLTAQSAGILTFAASAMADGDWLLFGHDNASIASWTTIEAPNSGTNIQRLAREWKVNETNYASTLTVTIDKTLLPALPAQYLEYYLLVDADGDFSSGATNYLLTSSGGNNYQATGLTIPNGSFVSIACIRPTIDFTVTSAHDFENAGAINLQIQLNYARSASATVVFAANGASTATGGGTDYSLSASPITITAGSTTNNIVLTLVNDVAIEVSETAIIDLSAPTGAQLGTATSYTYTINDNDSPRTIGFQAATSNAAESVNPANITLAISSASGSAVTVDYVVTGGTATGGGTDYTLVSGTATIPGDNVTTTVLVPITINEDALAEANETITLAISNPNINANLGALATQSHVYTINDNDASPTVQFTAPASSGQESASPGTIEVSLSSVSGRAITVDYTVTAGTATGGGTDYTLANGTLTIPAGSATGNISPVIIDDAVIEGGETFSVTITNPTGATLGATTTNVYTISDNDNNGYTGPGGVGNSTNNKIWLKAGTIAQADGTAVTNWADVSGNAYNFGQATGGLQPTYKTGILNGQPIVRFNGANALNCPTVSSAAGDHTIFGVLYSSTTTYLFDNNEAASGRFIAAISPGNGAYYDAAWKGTAHTVGGTAKLYSWVLDDAGAESFVNGTSYTTGTFATTCKMGPTQVLGSRYDQSTQMMTGDIGDWIVYQGALNSAQRIIVENYLSSKYALTIANDKYVYDVASGNEVAGIGRVNSTNLHPAAQSAGILTISSPSAMADNEYLLFGHDNGSIASWTTTETPSSGSNLQRISREWRVNKTGTIGTVSVGISSTLLPALPAGYTTYYALIDADGDFSSGAILYPMSLISGSNYEASGITLSDAYYISVACVKPIIQYTSLTGNQFEPTSPGLVGISLNYPLKTNVTVNYSVTGGTATGSGTDYILASGTATITAGNTTTNLSIVLINDAVSESSETIVLDMSSPSAGVSLGTNTTYTFTINDDDNARKINFTAASSNASEATATATLTIQSTSASASPITVNYAVTGGTATGSGTDYTLASGTATIPGNSVSTTTTFTIAINEDILNEANETIIITLSNPGNCNLAATNTTHTYTINDNDALPTVQFSAGSRSGQESTSPGAMEVSLSSISGQAVTVDYTVAAGTATSGTDYILANGTLTIPAGSTLANISPVVIDDAVIEGGETFVVTLVNPTGATLGGTVSNTYTISDNDNNGYTGPGGVGNSTNNKLWLKAGTIAQADGTAVTTWADASGNAYNFGQATGALQPTYKTGILNNQPVVRFNGANALNSATVTSAAGDHTVFGVLNSTSNSYLFDNNEPSSGRFITAISPGNGAYYDGAWKATAHTVGGTAKLITWVLDDAGAESFVNGTSYTTGTFATTCKMGTTQVLGSRYDQSTYMMNGDIGDWIVYQGALNSAQRIIVENYLSSKYDLAIANDKFTYDAANGNEVAGIGRVNSTNQHTAAQSAGILTISSPSALADNDFLLFGHDNSSYASWTTTETPISGADLQRITREWRVNKTGTVGTVSIGISSTLLPALPAGYSTYYVMVDADGDFSTGASLYPMSSISGANYEASGISLADGNYITVACVKHTIQFTNTLTSVSEPNGPATVQLTLNYPYPSTVSVNYSVSGGTATGSGTDYTLASGTASITAGNTTTNINITLVNDVLQESDETILLAISGPSANVSLGTNTANTFYILDDDNARKIAFSATSSSGTEATSAVVLTVQINSVDAVNPTTVNYIATGGTATGGGTDYTLVSGTVTVPAGSTTATFTVTVVDDALAESSETIVVTLVSATNSNIGTNQLYTYTITDNDVAPTIQFLSATNSGTEGTSPGSIPIILSAASGQNITVVYTVADGTATGNGPDYTLATGALTIPAGSTTAILSPSITNDILVETPENFTVVLSAPTGATLGATTTNTFTIFDNDYYGYTGPGGVGNSTNNKLWLKAGVIAQADGTAVTTWADASGNGYNFGQATAGLQPVYKTGILNGQPVVRFGGTKALNSTLVNSSSGDHTIFGVLNSSVTTYLFDNNEASSGRFIAAISPGNGAYYDGAWKATAHTIGATVKLYSWVLDDAGAESFVNGTSYTTGTFGNTCRMGPTQVLGSRYDQSTQMMNGDIGDWIVYQGALNSAQRIIVENYLAAKYGLTIANDYYAYQATHFNELAGIGYQNSTNFHTAAQSAGILKISNPSSLNTTGDYLLFGHDNTSIAAWTSTENPGAGIKRLAREWRFDESGSMGTVSITIDFTSLPAIDAGYNGYAVLIDADGDFTSGAVIKALTLQSGNLYNVDAVSITDGYYIAIAEVQNISNATGNYNNGATWLTGIVPGTGQNTTIISPHVVTLSGNQLVGSLTVSNGGTLTLGSNTLTIDAVGGTLSVSTGATFNTGTGTVNYGAAGAQCVGGNTYNNLTISGSGTKTLCGNITVAGNCNISAGTLDADNAANYSISLGGNWINNGTFTARGGTVNLNGTTTQTITSTVSTSFYNLQINNSFATKPQIALSNPVTISNTLALTTGVIQTDATNILTITNSATNATNSGSATSYVSGPIRWNGTTGAGPYVFPTGKGNTWRRVAVSGVTAATDFTCEYFNSKHGHVADADMLVTPTLGLRRVSWLEYFDVARTAGVGNAAVTLYWENATTEGINSCASNGNLVVGHYTGGKWENANSSGTTTITGSCSGATSGTVKSDVMTTFSPFDFGDLTGGVNPMPIELLSFNAQANGKIVDLSWSTASETNNDYFTVERTRDGNNFEIVGTVKGAGTSTSVLNYTLPDQEPAGGISYYRLKQTDFDGKFFYSDLEMVSFETDKDFSFDIYPNPSNDGKFNLQINATNKDEVLLIVYDVLGNQMYSKVIIVSENDNNIHAIDPSQKLPPGVYFITATSDDKVFNKKLIVN